MKILQFSDLHLGMENFGRLDPASGIHSRLRDFLASLDQIVDLAISEHVDAVLFAGDAYKTRDPTPTVEREFAKRLRRLTKAGLPTVLLVGNHDVPNAEGRANALDVFGALEITGLTVSRQPELLKLETKSGLLQVVTLPWVNPSLYLGRLEQPLPPDQVEAKLLEDMGQVWHQLLDDATKTKAPTVALVHGAIEGAAYQGETSIFRGSDLPLPKTWFTAKPLLYTAVGHIHRYQVVNEQPPVVYAGSPNYIDWSEWQDEKGVVLISIGESKLRQHAPEALQTAGVLSVGYQFKPLTVRLLKSIQVAVQPSDPNPTDTVLKRLAIEPLEDKVVRLVIEATPEVRKLTDERQVRQKLREAYFAAGIVWDLHRPEAAGKRSRELKERTDQELIQLYGERRGKSKTEVAGMQKLYAEWQNDKV